MNAPRSANSQQPVASSTQLSQPSLRTRRIVSLVLALHLLAIVTAPMSMHPAAPLWVSLWQGFRPYLEAMYLNHGYHFFAPDPGPSHLIRYELDFADGRSAEGIFPSPREHVPRLLYHRHFMLSEYANRLAVNDEQAASLKILSQSFANHLMTERNATRARLYLRRHYIPTPDHVRQGLPLDAAEFIAERSLGEFAFDGSTIPTEQQSPSDSIPQQQPSPVMSEPEFEVARLEVSP